MGEPIKWRATEWRSECGSYHLTQVLGEDGGPFYAYAIDRRTWTFVPGAAGELISIEEAKAAVERARDAEAVR
jgi:hypothetical protein